MNTVARLSLYVAGLALVFGVMFIAGRALVPEETVATWTREARESTDAHSEMEQGGSGHDEGSGDASHVRGLAIEEDGYHLSPVEAPSQAGQPGELSFRVIGPDGEPFTDFAVNHEKELHLIVVRSDGTGFEHVHPELDPASGLWTTPWEWKQGGNYRVFADFLPEGDGDQADITLGRNVEVAGEYVPVPRPPSRTDSVDGFVVTLSGELVAGESRELTAEITREGEPETHLEPYLGAFGHLVALREGDLAYLHVHAEGGHADGEEEDSAHSHGGPTAGPEINFETAAPTAGRYLLYLDFKVDGRVHTAEFVLEAK